MEEEDIEGLSRLRYLRMQHKLGVSKRMYQGVWEMSDGW